MTYITSRRHVSVPEDLWAEADGRPEEAADDEQ
jgi:hypothetical protein